MNCITCSDHIDIYDRRLSKEDRWKYCSMYCYNNYVRPEIDCSEIYEISNVELEVEL